MADCWQKYHLKKTCANYDITSNLRQKKHGEVIKRQSKGLMSARSSHSNNFSAWIERFKSLDFVKDAYNEEPGEAQIAAMEMQEKLAQIEKNRNERLEKFQQDVHKRVQRVRRERLNEEISKSIEKLEKESNVVCQSAFPKRIPSGRNGTCSFRSNISVDKIKNIMTGEANVDPSHNIENVLKSVDGIDQNIEKIKSQSNQARACLVSKIIETDGMELPGGVWEKPKSSDLEMRQSEIDQSKLKKEERSTANDQKVTSALRSETGQRGILLNDMWKNFDADEAKRLPVIDEAASIDNFEDEQKQKMNDNEGKERKKIRFHLPDKDVPNFRKANLVEGDKAKPRTDVDLIHDHLVRKCTKEERERKNQYWTYRKLFMDIEREKVRERQRRKRHQQVMSRLKRDKEIERTRIEKEVETVLPSNTNEEQEDRTEQRHYLKKTRNEGKVITRRKETFRYIEALKNLIRQKSIANEKLIPSICSCGESILDTNPETCANNCIFYKNPQGTNTCFSYLILN